MQQGIGHDVAKRDAIQEAQLLRDRCDLAGANQRSPGLRIQGQPGERRVRIGHGRQRRTERVCERAVHRQPQQPLLDLGQPGKHVLARNVFRHTWHRFFHK